MANSRALTQMIGGGIVAALIIASLGDGDALAARSKNRRKRGRGLVLQQVNVRNASSVPANRVVEMVFSSDVDVATVNPAIIQVRAENGTQTGFTKQVFGSFQVAGNIVRFYPRLPTHLRDPASPTNAFYPQGAARDNAAENAGFQPSTNYKITIRGSDSISALRSTRNRPLRRSETVQFSTAAASDPSELWTTTSYLDSPPPQYAFSNPPDRSPSAADQYAVTGGTRDVPNDISMSLFCTKVPLSPTTVRVLGNVDVTLTARKGDTSQRRPVATSVYVEQNFATTLLSVKPKFPLADLGTYALRVTKNVKDLTEQYDFQSNPDRGRLRSIYDWLAQARSDNPALSFAELPDPPANLIADWPVVADTAARAVLKGNILAVGDAYPDELDPRVMILFSSRDEPVSDAALVVNFLKGEDLFDSELSTAEWDISVPGAASAIMTVAGGSAADGDFQPTSNTTLNLDTFQGGYANFRDIIIPQGVTVNITGSRPGGIRGINFTLDGTIAANGFDGEDASTGGYSTSLPPAYERRGGKGGPGGGEGGDAGENFYHRAHTSSGTRAHPAGGSDRYAFSQNLAASAYSGDPGLPGFDVNLEVATADDGGRGGLGGTEALNGTYYQMGGSGGGGGSRTAGTNGTSATSSYATWNGSGGAGGAGAIDGTDLDPLVGGAGGGAGGNSNFAYQYTSYYYWTKVAGAGGGGGGALVVQTARVQTVGSKGVFQAQGGEGGNGTGPAGTSALEAGPGGGGGGGSVLLRSTGGFSFADAANAFDVSGGTGGNSKGSYGTMYGGNGGTGFIRTEDPNASLTVPTGTSGVFDPVGGGVPSIVYSKWADLGVQDPRVVNLTKDDIVTDPTANDAIFVELQMTSEHPSVFGTPDVSAIDANQNSTDTDIMSQWTPLKVHDNTGIPGGAFNISGYDPGSHGTEYVFPIDQLNGHGYRFVRYRITFQLDDGQTRDDPLPSVDQITQRFQFNF